MPAAGRSASPAVTNRRPHAAPERSQESASPSDSRDAEQGANWSSAMGAGSIVPLVLVVTSPLLCNFMAFISMSPELSEPTLSAFTTYCTNLGWADALTNVLYTFCLPSNVEAWIFFGVFMLLAAFLCLMPGSTRYGPATATGHVPKYTDNGLLHCFLFSAVFFGCSNLGAGLYDVGVIYDVFPPLIGALNITGLLFCLFLYVKGLSFPSTKDCGSSGSIVIDYYWGTELYPRFLGLGGHFALGQDPLRFTLIFSTFHPTMWMSLPKFHPYLDRHKR